MKSLSKLALCLLLAMSLTVSAFAAQVPDSLVAENLNGQQRLVKTYTLSQEVDPDELKEEDFSYDGYLYTWAYTTKVEHPYLESKTVTETVTVNTAKNDLAQILAELSPSMPYEKDGFSGELALDHIAGHNYVKLRDIGKAVGFNVFWDADSGCVQIETGAPYTGEAPSAEAVPSAAAPSDADAAKQDIVARTNALRAEHGIAALTADDQLMRAAQVRADEMAATGTYSHTRPDGRKYYTVTDCRQVGENIHQIPLLYLAQQKTALAETLVYSWSKSAGHMENMTDESYAAIGVGLARGTDANGLECWYCVQLFLRSGYSISAVDKPATK